MISAKPRTVRKTIPGLAGRRATTTLSKKCVPVEKEYHKPDGQPDCIAAIKGI